MFFDSFSHDQVDKADVSVQSVLLSLMQYELIAEEFGGDVQVAAVSSKTGEGVEDLLEKILLQVSFFCMCLS